MSSRVLAFLVAELLLLLNGYAPASFDGKRAPNMAKMGIFVVYSAILGRDLSLLVSHLNMGTDRQNVFVLLRMPKPPCGTKRKAEHMPSVWTTRVPKLSSRLAARFPHLVDAVGGPRSDIINSDEFLLYRRGLRASAAAASSGASGAGIPSTSASSSTDLWAEPPGGDPG